MDNTKKRKIVRNFVIGYLIIQVLTIVVYLGFWSLHPEGITNVTKNVCPRLLFFRIIKGRLYLII